MNKFLVITIFSCISSVCFADEGRQIGEISKNKFLFCKFGAKNSIYYQTLNRKGELQNGSVVTTKKITTTIKDLQKLIKSPKSKGVKRDNAKQILTNITLCRTKKFNLPANTVPNNEVIQDSDLPTQENIEYEASSNVAAASPELQGTCSLTTKSTVPYSAAGNSQLLAPTSGRLRCEISGNVTQPIVVIIYTNESPAQWIFSEIVNPDQIKEKVFYIPLCTEFPGCFRANKTIAAIDSSGIKVQIQMKE